MNHINITLVSLAEFETPELLKIKKERSKGEYCWTCTPSIISHVLQKFGVPNCTYIDSDLIFYSDPAVLINEMADNGKNVLITEHRFSPLPRIYEEKRAGRFCVQFITFVNDASSLSVLEKWRTQCLDWCFARHEHGKFGDQKYLDDWDRTYGNVHVLQHMGGGIAPWNLQQYEFIPGENRLKAKVKKTGSVTDVVFYHFQYVKFMDEDTYDIGWYFIRPQVRKLFYFPYIQNLREIEINLHKLESRYQTRYAEAHTKGIKDFFKSGLKKIIRYNIIKVNNSGIFN